MSPAHVEREWANYSNLYYEKQRLLGCLAGVLGQLANEPQPCQAMVEDYPVLDCFLYIFHAPGITLELKSKVAFGLKQLCHNRWQIQQRVGKHCIQTLVKDLRESVHHVEFITSELLLLQVLSDFKLNCFDMKTAGIQDSFSYLLDHTRVDAVYTRVSNLQERINRQTRYDYFAT